MAVLSYFPILGAIMRWVRNMDIPSLQTPRLILQPWKLEEAETLWAILQEEDILRYFPDPFPPSLERVQKYITLQMAHWQLRDYGHWAVVDPVTQTLLGWVGLEYLPELNETEVAYLLSRRAWGKGLATEAAQAAVDFGTQQAGLAKIIGLVHPDNTASARVLQKCGFSFSRRIPLWGLDLDYYCR